MYNKDKTRLPLFIATTGVLGAVPFILLVNFGGYSLWLAYSFAAMGALQSIPGPNIKGVLISVNKPEDRGVVFACSTLVDNIGKGLGPSLVCIVDWAVGSRTIAFSLAFCAWGISAWIVSQLEETILKDAEIASEIESHL